MKFSELGLNDALLKAIKRSGFEEATPIEEQTDRMIDDLKNDIKSDDIVVLKGSHGMHLENVLARLR